MADGYILKSDVRRELRLRRYFETADLLTATAVIDYLPDADVRDKREVEELVDEAIRILNAVNSSGRMDYGDYCELYDTISAIYGTERSEDVSEKNLSS